MKYRLYERFIKRILDFLMAASFILLFWWLYLVIAFLVRINLGSPVFFSQERPGKGEKLFRLYKFRTMNDKRDAEGGLLPDEYRITKFGSFLRASSLDEIPEVFNILKGDMAIVGPRPLLVKYLPYYTDEERKRHSVRPGLTGLAQVSGRNFLHWEERFKLDCEYVESITFVNDVKILIKTIGKVLKQSNIMESPADLDFKDLDVERRQQDIY